MLHTGINIKSEEARYSKTSSKSEETWFMEEGTMLGWRQHHCSSWAGLNGVGSGGTCLGLSWGTFWEEAHPGAQTLEKGNGCGSSNHRYK